MRQRLLRIAVAGTAALLLTAAGPATERPADSPVNVPEPDGIWTGPQRGYTPATLSGAVVVDIDALDALIARDRPVLLDVSLADRRPAGFPADRPWLPAHRSVPGAVWMANAGAAPLEPGREDLFLKRVADLTGGDKGRAIVTFLPSRMLGQLERGQAAGAPGLWPRALVPGGHRGLAGAPPHHGHSRGRGLGDRAGRGRSPALGGSRAGSGRLRAAPDRSTKPTL